MSKKRSVPCPTFAHINNFWKITIFHNFFSNLSEKLFLGVYNDKYNAIQVLESTYIESNYLY